MRAAPRSAALWILGWAHFVAGAVFFLVLWLFRDPKSTDALLRTFARRVLRLAGARLEVRALPGCDDPRPGVVVCNHVNLFDAFTLLASLPSRYTRGLELESHFTIPFYGWLARRAGNVPVPVVKTPGDLRRTWTAASQALRAGTSLAVFPEGGRTLDGRLKPFRDGAFRLAQACGAPVYPVTISGAFAWNRRGSWRLSPARVVVTLHAPLETAGLSPEDVPALRDRARAVIDGALSPT